MTGHIRLTALQRQVWLAERLLAAPGAYNMPVCLELRGRPDTTVLRAALDGLLARHEVLRWVFPEADGDPYAQDGRATVLPLTELDWRDRSPAAQSDALTELVAVPFDLARGPLCAATLARVADGTYWLVLCVHHLVADGWSVQLLLHDLALLYDAYAAGSTADLPAPGTPYREFAAQTADPQDADRQLEFWRRQLDGAPQRLRLPFEATRTPAPGRAASVEFDLEARLAGRLEALAAERGGSVFMVLLTAYLVTLARFTGTGDVLAGTPVAYRLRPELLRTVGLLVNTVPIRMRLEPHTTLGEALAQVRSRLLDGMSRLDVSYEQIVDAVVTERELGVPALCQAMFVWEEFGGEDAGPGEPGGAFRGLDPAIRPVPSRGAKYDLALVAGAQAGRITGRLEYPEELFDPASVRDLAASYTAVLSALAEDPGRLVGEVNLATPEQRRRLDHWWTERPDYLAAATIHELVEAQARQTPDAPALTFRDEAYSYRWLNAQANRLARYLRETGVRGGDVVALCLRRSPELVVAWLGVLKAGAAFVTLDPEVPLPRQRFVVADSRAVAVLSHAAFAADFTADVAADVAGGFPLTPAPFPGVPEPPAANEPPRVAVWEEVTPVLPGLAAEDLGLPVAAGDLAYLIYTSGTTGRPKAAMLAHRGVVNLALSQRDLLDIGPGGRMLQFTTGTCDGSVWEWVSALANGASLALLDAADPQEQTEQGIALLSRPGVTVAGLTPSVVELLGTGAMPSMRSLVLAGEACPPALLADWATRLPAVFNVYGPTEASVSTSAFRYQPGYPPNTIGRPLPNVRVYVLSDDGRVLPSGVVGEMCIAGVGLALGYLDRPELTAEKFVSYPLGPGGEPVRVYRSGDLGRYLPDGNLVFEGRRDTQVKVRGYRVELEEVAWALRQHPWVAQCVVTVSTAGRPAPYLTAYVVAGGVDSNPGRGAATRAELRAFLADRLAGHMLPDAYVFLDTLPLNRSSMKVDTASLPAPGGEAFVRCGATPPRSATEKELAAVWSELLGGVEVGREDSFFRLGGNSLLAVRLSQALARRWMRQVPLRKVFEHHTLEAMARYLDTSGEGPAEPRWPAVPRSPDREDWPLSFAQGRMWFLAALGGPESTAYHVPLAVRLSGEVRRDRLAWALAALVARHEVLRTAYPDGPDGPIQRILPAAPVDLPECDLRGVPAEDRQARLDVVMRELDRPFDLAGGENLRARLVTGGQGDCVLHLSLHHIAVDGWSIEVLLADLAALYRGEHLEPLPLRYVDYACWQRGAATDRFGSQLDFWTSRLAGCPARLDLPTDRPRPARQDFRGAVARRRLTPELSGELARVAEAHGVSHFMLYLAAFQVWLGRLAGAEDVVIGTPAANRDHADLDQVTGLFVNTLPIRLTFTAGERFSAVLERIRATVLDANANQELPFEYLVDELGVPRDLSHSPLFQAMFLLQDRPVRRLDLGTATGELAARPGSVARFDLTMLVQLDAGGAELNLEYATALFNATTAAEWLESFERFLRGVAAQPRLPVDELNLLPERTRAFLARAAAGPRRDYGAATMPDLVVAAAGRHPGRVAVADATGTSTYADLVGTAQRVAAGLRRRGVRPGEGVAVAVPRDRHLPATMLGVLLAGAFLVPLDPAHPARRLGYIVADSGARLVLGTAPILDGLGVPMVTPAELLAEPVPAADRPGGAALASLAYTIYTSGSTGEPKGVMVGHAALANFLHAVRDELRFGSQERLLAVTTTAFDISLLELFLPLVCGARVVIADEESATEPKHLIGWLAEHEITVLQATPATWQMLVELAWEPPPGFTGLVGGEPLPPRVAAYLHRHTSRAWNLYGPTEATIWCTAARLTGPDQVHIGRPLANTEAHVLGEGLAPVPRGAAGELYLGGAGLALGYRGKPELTARRFLTDPRTGSRLYATGDLARVLPSGDLEFLARRDAQLKIRGFRIEPGEVEAVLAVVPGVRRAVVLCAGADADAQLVAFLQAEDDQVRAAARQRAAEYLPDYMRPSWYVALPELPRTPNGKVDTAALLARAAAQPAADEDRAPLDALEFRVAAAVGRVLGVPGMQAREDFFATGGTSLAAVRLAAELEREFGVDVRVADVFRHPTVAELAGLLRRPGAVPDLEAVLQLDGAADAPPVFLVHPAGGTVYGYAGFAAHLRGFRVHGLNHPHLHDLEHRYATLAEMAAEYVATIRFVCPDGPYRLVGWSFGGTLAYEVGRQLEQAGASVAGLVLLDAHQVADAGELPPLDVAGLLANLGLDPGADPYLEKDLSESERLMRSYRAGALAAPVLLLKPTERNGFEPRLFRNPRNGWAGHAGDLTVRYVPGDHGSMLDRSRVGAVAELAAEFLSGRPPVPHGRPDTSG